MGELLPSPSSSPSPPPPPPPPMIPIPLPYEVLFSEPCESIPEPLPSPEEIEDSPTVIKELSARCTTRVGESFVVKYGAEVEPIEGQNMRFVREHTDILVPRVFAVYQRSISPGLYITYIIMENIPGETLEFLWDKLSNSEKSNITDQLRKGFSSLRKIPHPGYFGSLGESRLRDGIFWTDGPIPEMNGPFATEEELIRGMIEKYNRDCGEFMLHKVGYYRRVLPRVLRGNNEPVFTHNDFQRKNVIVRPDGKVAIIDWAASGWYPVYWEYAAALFACGKWKDDWYAYVIEILDEFPNHFVWMNTIRIEMWS